MVNPTGRVILALTSTLFLACCAGTQSIARVQPVEIIESAENARRDLADLHAQQIAAEWTRIGAIASVASVGVSAIGLFFIYKQLRHSADAVQEAARASKAAAESAQATLLSSRPWLKVEYLNEGQVYEDGLTPLRLVITANVTNVGATPAIGASTYAVLIQDAQQETLEREIKNFLIRDPRNPVTIFPNDSSIKTGWNLDVPNDTEGQWWVAILTSYRFSGSDQRHVSGVALGVHMLSSGSPEATADGTLTWPARAFEVPNLRVDAT